MRSEGMRRRGEPGLPLKEPGLPLKEPGLPLLSQKE
jgi:hypothetical protein